MARDEIDRGWAWAVVAGVTVINLAVLPIQQCFGLIFAERFTRLGITATQTSLILHLNGTITCSLGLISGPMMKRFTFRQVAYFGSLIVVFGICTTAFAVLLPTIIISYCVIIGIGQGIIYLATNLALNTYFRRKRNIAMGFAVTMTGLGPILTPLLIDRFLENYATTGTLLILAGIAAHSLVGASLLKPLQKQKETTSTEVTEMLIVSEENNSKSQNKTERSRTEDQADLKNNTIENAEKISQAELKKSEATSFFKKISINLDLDLLRDNRYIVVVLGMGMALVAETNFNAMIPFVLAELASLDRTSIATVISIQAAADITGRLCVPLLAQRAGWTCRNLYVISLLGSILGRASMYCQIKYTNTRSVFTSADESDFWVLSTWGNFYIGVIGVSLIVGLAKGTRAVFQALIIPDYVPLDRLPAASGIQMVCNGVLSISVGPIIGLVHDSTESYVGALYFTSFLSLFCVFLWTISGLWNPGGNVLRLNQRNSFAEQENSRENT